MSNSERSEKAIRTRRQYLGEAGQEPYVPDVQDIAKEMFPDFRNLGHEYFFGDVMSRQGLVLKERNMIIIAVLQAIHFRSGTKGHMHYALNIGTSREEVLDVIIHVAPYAGWPLGVELFDFIEEVYPGFIKKIQEKSPDYTPSRNLLSLRQRSMITMAAVLTLRFNNRLMDEMGYALTIGISRKDILEVILQATPYAGWPAGIGAISAAKDVFSSKG